MARIGHCAIPGAGALHADSGQNYESRDLPTEFQKQDLRVRFTLKLRVTYPSLEEELEIVARSNNVSEPLQAVCGKEELFRAQEVVRDIKVTDVLLRYVVDLVRATREPAKVDKELGRAIEFGASPRASIAFTSAARARALIDGRNHVVPDDVKAHPSRAATPGHPGFRGRRRRDPGRARH